MNENFSNSEEDIENKLLFIFSNVNEWLKFAEVKNAGMTAFSIAGISGIIAFVTLFQKLSVTWKSLFLFPVFCLLIACLISLLSFYPRINRLGILNSSIKSPLDSDNLLFFGDLVKYDTNSFIDKISNRYFSINQINESKRLTDIADQIIVNSRITEAKYKFFKVSVFFSFLSLVLLIIFSIIFGIINVFSSS